MTTALWNSDKPVAGAAHAERVINDAPGWRLTLFTVWVMATLASFRTRDLLALSTAGAFDFQVKFQVASWIIFGIVAAYLIAMRRAEFRIATTAPLLWFTLFALCAGLSAIYSPYPMLSLFRAGQILIAIALVATVPRIARNLYSLILLYVLLNWVLVLLGELDITFGIPWIKPAHNIYIGFGGTDMESWRFTSALGHPSMISIVAGIGAIGIYARTPERMLSWQVPVIMLLLITVLLTVSRTAIAGTAIGILVIALARGHFVPIALAMGIVASLLFAASPAMQDDFVGFFLRGQSFEEISTFNNREAIYHSAIERIGENIWFGSGFRSSRFELLDELALGMGVTHAHNLVLEAWQGLGAVGATLSLIALASFLVSSVGIARHPIARIHWPRPIRWEGVALACPVVAFCVLDSGFATEITPFTLAFIGVAAAIAHRRRSLKQYHEHPQKEAAMSCT